MADVWKANHSECEVIHVGKPGDWGIDVLYVDSNDQDWLIQVKRRSSPSSTEGFETLERLAGALLLHDSLRGIIVSTANRFSVQLRKGVDILSSMGYTIELTDKGKLIRMLDPVLPVAPWNRALQRLVPELRNELEFESSRLIIDAGFKVCPQALQPRGRKQM